MAKFGYSSGYKDDKGYRAVLAKKLAAARKQSLETGQLVEVTLGNQTLRLWFEIPEDEDGNKPGD